MNTFKCPRCGGIISSLTHECKKCGLVIKNLPKIMGDPPENYPPGSVPERFDDLRRMEDIQDPFKKKKKRFLM